MNSYCTKTIWRCPLCKSRGLIKKEFNSNWRMNLYRGGCTKKCDEKAATFATKDYPCAVELWNSFVRTWSEKHDLKLLS